jgi:hypothetical protein
LLGDLTSKTVVYVTHQIEFLPSADLILVSNFLVKFKCLINAKICMTVHADLVM